MVMIRGARVMTYLRLPQLRLHLLGGEPNFLIWIDTLMIN
jgi:hypothetical protein